jgi:hypothetical protein
MQQPQPKPIDRSPAKAKSWQGLLSARSRSLFAIVSNSHPISSANPPDLQIQALCAQIGQNRRRIERIHRQNVLLSKQVAQIKKRQQSPLSDDLDPDRRSDIQLPKNNRTKPAQPSRRNNWIWILLVVICTVLLCGTIGFAIARAISLL